MRNDLQEVIGKARIQTSISTTGTMLPVLTEALLAFEDAKSPAGAYTRALKHWYFGRQANSKRGVLDEIRADIKKILEILEETRSHENIEDITIE